MNLGTSEKFSGAVQPSSIEQANFEQDLWASRITEIPSNMTKRFEWSGGNCIYSGAAPRSLAEGTDGWLLQKFTYDGSNQCTKIEIAYGNWTERTTESYG